MAVLQAVVVLTAAATLRRMTVCGVAHMTGDVLQGVVHTSGAPTCSLRTLAARGVPMGVIALVTVAKTIAIIARTKH